MTAFRMTLSGRTQMLHGVGLHSGERAAAMLGPGAPESGLIFQRADRPAAPDLPARWDRIVPADRCTALGGGPDGVAVVEHVLAACALAGLDDAVIQIEGPEPPAADGSALPFLELIDHVGLVAGPRPRTWLVPRERVEVRDGDRWRIMAEPADEPSFTFRYRGGGRLDGAEASWRPGRDDPRDVACARTFCFENEIAALRARGLGRGLNESSVLVLRADGSALNAERGALEAVRHKLLDLVGDLALAGGPLAARVVAEGTGHAAHARFLEALAPALVRRPGGTAGVAGGDRSHKEAA
jgi:UDP-3-O-[3-hydroxymyristoyl] N-acetylglucosamine deacetylase